MYNLLLQSTKYNLWANKRIADVLLANPSTINTEINSSFKSISQTLHHIWGAELIWLARLNQEVITWPTIIEDHSKGIEAFLNTSLNFQTFVQNASDTFLNATTNYKNVAGEMFTSINADIIQHCMNHSTFHRGQIITMLRLQGVDKIKSTDLITYLRENK